MPSPLYGALLYAGLAIGTFQIINRVISGFVMNIVFLRNVIHDKHIKRKLDILPTIRMTPMIPRDIQL